MGAGAEPLPAFLGVVDLQQAEQPVVAAVMWAQRRAISSPSGSMSGLYPVGRSATGATTAGTGETGTGAVGTGALVAGWPGVGGAGEGGTGASATGAAAAVDMVV